MSRFAIYQNNHSLKWASEDLKNDKELVKYAVTNNWDSLCWASVRLQNDREVVMCAIEQEGEVMFENKCFLLSDHN
jgi:hypothetical protein